MPELQLSETAEEILADLWVAQQEGGQTQVSTSRPNADESALQELRDAGLVSQESVAISLTKKGETEAAGVVRRERLAERLLADVLNVSETLIAQAACRFEHVLQRGLDDQICTLLGHPRACPHGRPIPSGECCRAGADAAGKVVSSLADLNPGQGGVIAYIQSQRRDLLPRLLSMGALPGARIVLRQRFPSYVFDLGHGQVAVDSETARDIYVRLEPPTTGPGTPRSSWLARPLRRLRRRGRGL